MPFGPSSPLFVFAHGAGAGRDHPWMRRVADGLTRRGVTVVTFNFPYIEARRSAPDRGPVLEEAFQRAWREAAGAHGPMFAGGKSMGGRIASQAAARDLFDPPAAGLVFFGYPLHPPGKPDQRRDRHLPAIRVPMLFLHGTRDPFGSPDEMRALTRAYRRPDSNSSTAAIIHWSRQRRRIPRATRSIVRWTWRRRSCSKDLQHEEHEGHEGDEEKTKDNSKTFGLHCKSDKLARSKPFQPTAGGGAKLVGPFVAAVEADDVVRHA